jgi:hypothetical protein
MSLECKEKRVNTRKCLAVPLDYTFSGSEADKSKDFFAGTTFDVSNSGISFYTNRSMPVGGHIEILSKCLWNEQRGGTVKWCRTLSSNHYLVGVALQF